MKTTTLILNLALLAALPVAADEPILRYNLSGGMHLNVEQEIYVGDRIGKFTNGCKPSSRAGVTQNSRTAHSEEKSGKCMMH